MGLIDPRLLLLDPADNVVVCKGPMAAGTEVLIDGATLRLSRTMALGDKLARRAIAHGAPVVKYAAPIGVATADVVPGEHVHIHNLASNYTPTQARTRED